jgi:hypothetical protein
MAMEYRKYLIGPAQLSPGGSSSGTSVADCWASPRGVPRPSAAASTRLTASFSNADGFTGSPVASERRAAAKRSFLVVPSGTRKLRTSDTAVTPYTRWNVFAA